jgi:imidazolonepropionase
VYASDRAQEFEERLGGVSYEQIARRGGGILATVNATRAASESQLIESTLPRLDALLAEGVTTIEVKSGYGLSLEHERKQLLAARGLGRERGVSVTTTFLGAHTLPPEFAGRSDDYIRSICDEMLPALARDGLVDAVDVFCEDIGFTLAQARRIFEAAKALDLHVKLHAEQLSNHRGAQLAAEFGALSADHLEHADETSVVALAKAGTVAVLLPGAFHVLRETRLPPIEAFRTARVAMAVATDCNPGTSPLQSLRQAMQLACTHFRLSPEDALRGATVNGAKALGLDDRGTLRAGLRAVFVRWRVREPAALCYWLGGDLAVSVHCGGRRVA